MGLSRREIEATNQGIMSRLMSGGGFEAIQDLQVNVPRWSDAVLQSGGHKARQAGVVGTYSKGLFWVARSGLFKHLDSWGPEDFVLPRKSVAQVWLSAPSTRHPWPTGNFSEINVQPVGGAWMRVASDQGGLFEFVGLADEAFFVAASLDDMLSEAS